MKVSQECSLEGPLHGSDSQLLSETKKTNILRNICVYLAPFKKVPHLQSVMFLSTVSNATLRSSSNKAEILDSSIFNTLIFAFSVLCCG